jgi:spore germination protein
MIIHAVQPGDTIQSIAKTYDVNASRLIIDNGILNSDDLVVGQTIVVAFPELTYTVQDGDTLFDIASSFDVTIKTLLRNNPYLSEREYIYPGETIVIAYGNDRGSIQTNGYAYTFISEDLLRKTLPYLTYLTVMGNRIVNNAEIEVIDDFSIIKTAKNYGVVPIMSLSTLTTQGIGSRETAYNIIYNDALTEKLIYNILNILRVKGYYGINIPYQYLTSANLAAYETFTDKLANALHQEGYLVFITISRNVVYSQDMLSFERIDYSKIGLAADTLNIVNYNWGYSYGPPAPVTSIHGLNEFLEYLLTQVPRNKIVVGLPILGYDWQLPFILGVSRANALTLDSALNLARTVDAVIEFDEYSQTPYFTYIETLDGIPNEHIVWFIDARSISALLQLVDKHELIGTGVWNLMIYSPQLWLILNSEYEIETVI